MERLYLTEEHEIFRQALRKFLEKEAVPNYEQWEKNKEVPRSFWKKLGEQGYLCPQVEEKYGGLGTDFGYAVVMNEEMERVGTGMVGISLHNDIVIPYIESYGTEEQKQRWLPGALTGDIITAIGMTEPGAGSDLANIQTTAIRDGDDYIINGEKTFITNGYTADLVVLVCKTDPKANPPHRGISLFVVEAGTPGFKKGKKLRKIGQHANDTSELIFEDVRVPRTNLLGEEGKGFYYLMEKLQQERLLVAIQCMASAEKMLELTIDYVKQRQAFGTTISNFQNTQFKIAEMATELEIGRTFVERLVLEHMKGKSIVTEVSMAKWWVSDLAKKIAGECMQLHGGYGYMEEYEIARRYRDIAVTSIYAGSNEIMKQIIAKNLL
ncbi:Butyryl-CoA dehydrogenase [Caldibacillus thermoamylovorans]|uniref:Acyl-[acyl-carrier-protein] dehydrogenase MbtN n=1 Tax=Caldibacillus thermoamylovorans TaxID=35841 RepID=A0ABD4ABB5_9BACI|nr:acyl-CoA dehydrogenase family protein [Caldibacillus thermoamylovorans]KIO67906.1 Butyryl-CoA dehydrogenase [Caldibacillus thermoamylovorans]KIO71348.1 Butyryl-CoA dehydrogenase [Caldibacillus thermoamylovorans]KIO73962.1 Butyryl-CoA dehydrogenase [Caldibacillus thermoamylovorans]